MATITEKGPKMHARLLCAFVEVQLAAAAFCADTAGCAGSRAGLAKALASAGDETHGDHPELAASAWAHAVRLREQLGRTPLAAGFEVRLDALRGALEAYYPTALRTGRPDSLGPADGVADAAFGCVVNVAVIARLLARDPILSPAQRLAIRDAWARILL